MVSPYLAAGYLCSGFATLHVHERRCRLIFRGSALAHRLWAAGGGSILRGRDQHNGRGRIRGHE
ncbi:predicted protein [Pyrenophora tritici-repentis Pt-1C-BFP]|uniref:Uncharacterized protein n=1 Tax=Pyrenophora tritici-repentis (strain Pt-1C-BFP) TaxID=426418 RepID=B2WIV8_PYRTR|nr:uncharacterized protein PTRG_09917 [Pyrenophora tritici-repentis Pt-1C-BFP]EDU42968.1 predicted protein [Pyrenophora tritici-repentis Pt-1C-BFP]